MPQLLAAKPQRLARLAWIGALVLVLRFVGTELHHVLDIHEPGEVCEACLVLERGSPALPASALPLPEAPPPSVVGRTGPAAAAPALLLAPLPRGPPLSSS